MGKRFFLGLLFTSSMINLWAQQPGSNPGRFEIPASVEFNLKYIIQLGNSNQLQVQVTHGTDMEHIRNIDSILAGFLKDLSLLKDSLVNPLSIKQIDYVSDAFNRKKIHFNQTVPVGSSFLLDGGELALLRTGQDTINLSGIINDPPAATHSKNTPHYYQLSFFMNDYNDLKQLSGQALNAKMDVLIQNKNKKWLHDRALDQWFLKSDKSIVASGPAGAVTNRGDYIELAASANIQNYKNYFVSSFSVGAMFNLRNQQSNITTRFGINWEPNFIFAKDNNNKLQTYRNDFLSISYGRDAEKGVNEKGVELQGYVSLAYLIRRQGDFFDKNTFRLGTGRIILKHTAIEPLLYFNNFLKGVTPGIRITQFF